MEKPVVCFLTLDGTVDFYIQIQKFVSWQLRHEKSAKVTQYACPGALKTCTSINSLGIKDVDSTYIRDEVCSKCKESQNEIFSDERTFVIQHQNADHDRFLESIYLSLDESRDLSSIIDRQYLDFPVCRVAFFDYSILMKSNLDTHLDDISIKRFIDGVKDCLILIDSFMQYLSSNKIDYLIYVNGNYSQNTIARLVFARYGVKSFSIEPQLTAQDLFCRVNYFPERLHLDPLVLFGHTDGEVVETAAVKKLFQNFGARIKGADFNAYTSLNISRDTQIDWQKFNSFRRQYSHIHSFFMSSEDELVPHSVTHGIPKLYNWSSTKYCENQFEFTQYLMNEAKNHPEIGFLIRLHPRMAINKRNNFESNEHRLYKKLLINLDLPKNILVLTGDSKLSSYYLINQSDLVIVAWSTIGIEALLMGKRVISIFPNFLMYPLNKLSNQPSNLRELNEALFSLSIYGVANKKKLIYWTSNAYERQFSPVLALRAGSNLSRRIGNAIRRICNSRNAYKFIASLFSLVAGYKSFSMIDRITNNYNLNQKVIKCNMLEIEQLHDEYVKTINEKLTQYHSELSSSKCPVD